MVLNLGFVVVCRCRLIDLAIMDTVGFTDIVREINISSTRELKQSHMVVSSPNGITLQPLYKPDYQPQSQVGHCTCSQELSTLPRELGNFFSTRLSLADGTPFPLFAH